MHTHVDTHAANFTKPYANRSSSRMQFLRLLDMFWVLNKK